MGGGTVPRLSGRNHESRVRASQRRHATVTLPEMSVVAAPHAARRRMRARVPGAAGNMKSGPAATGSRLSQAGRLLAFTQAGRLLTYGW